MSRSRICVAKVGGSQLSAIDLPRRLRSWLSLEIEAHPNTHYLLIVGGGKFVQAVREIDRASPIDAQAAHSLCIDLMDVTARLLGAMLPEITTVHCFHQIESCIKRPGATILCPREMLRKIEPKYAGTRLEAEWSVTSDAIAGRLAVMLSADELVLIKSIVPPVARSGGLAEWTTDLAALGYVDGFLSTLSAELASLRFTVLPPLE